MNDNGTTDDKSLTLITGGTVAAGREIRYQPVTPAQYEPAGPRAATGVWHG